MLGLFGLGRGWRRCSGKVGRGWRALLRGGKRVWDSRRVKGLVKLGGERVGELGGERVGELVVEWGRRYVIGLGIPVGDVRLGVTGAPDAASALVVGAIVGFATFGIALVTFGLALGPVRLILGTLRGKLCLWHSLHGVVVHTGTLVTDDAVGDWAILDPIPAVLGKPVVWCGWVGEGRWVSFFGHP